MASGDHHTLIWSPTSDGGPVIYTVATSTTGQVLGALWADGSTGCGWIDASGEASSRTVEWRDRILMAITAGQTNWPEFVSWWADREGAISWSTVAEAAAVEHVEVQVTHT